MSELFLDRVLGRGEIERELADVYAAGGSATMGTVVSEDLLLGGDDPGARPDYL